MTCDVSELGHADGEWRGGRAAAARARAAGRRLAARRRHEVT